MLHQLAETHYELYSEACVFRTPWDQPDYQGVLIFQVSLYVNKYTKKILKF